MATKILTPLATQKTTPQYRLPEAAQQAILQHSPAFQKLQRVENMRQRFIQKNGDDGTKISS